MSYRLIAICTLSLLLFATATRADNPHTLVREGNKEVLEQNLDGALERYLRAQAELDTLRPELLYNLGGVYARKGDTGRADTLFRSVAPYGGDDRLVARGDYNRGTALAEAQQFDQAVPALIDALRRDPHDQDAKINLELALRRQQQQEQQQEQQQNQDQQDQDQNEDQQDQQEQQEGDQDEQDGDQEEQEQDQDQQQDQQNPQNQDQQNQDQNEQNQQPQPENLNREMAERLLDQMQQDEKEQLRNVIRQQVPVQQKGTKKPW